MNEEEQKKILEIANKIQSGKKITDAEKDFYNWNLYPMKDQMQINLDYWINCKLLTSNK